MHGAEWTPTAGTPRRLSATLTGWGTWAIGQDISQGSLASSFVLVTA